MKLITKRSHPMVVEGVLNVKKGSTFSGVIDGHNQWRVNSSSIIECILNGKTSNDEIS